MPRLKDTKYEFQNSSGTPQDAKSKKIDKVVVYLKGSKAKTANKLAMEFIEIKKMKEEVVQPILDREQELKNKMKPYIKDVFDLKDSLYTRVIDTADVILTGSRMTTRESFDREKFIDKISKEFPKLKAKFLEIIEECKSVSDVSSRVDAKVKSKLKTEGFGDSIKALHDKIQAQISKFTEMVKNFLSGYDQKLRGWKQELIGSLQVEQHDVLISNTNKVLNLFLE